MKPFNNKFLNWIVHFDNNKLLIFLFCRCNDKKYLITADTDASWFCEQDYINNVYEITPT
jgi:hypothetical protein